MSKDIAIVSGQDNTVTIVNYRPEGIARRKMDDINAITGFAIGAVALPVLFGGSLSGVVVGLGITLGLGLFQLFSVGPKFIKMLTDSYIDFLREKNILDEMFIRNKEKHGYLSKVENLDLVKSEFVKKIKEKRNKLKTLRFSGRSILITTLTVNRGLVKESVHYQIMFNRHGFELQSRLEQSIFQQWETLYKHCE